MKLICQVLADKRGIFAHRYLATWVHANVNRSFIARSPQKTSQEIYPF